MLGDLGGSASLGGAGGANVGAGTGGSPPGGASGSGGNSGTLVFSSDFETGDFSDWGEEGSVRRSSGGVLAVVSDVAHGGGSSLSVSTDTLDSPVDLVLPADYDELLFGFWLRIDDAYTTYNWVIFHIDETMPGGGVEELFDLAISSPAGEPRFIIWEKPTLNGTDGGAQIAEAPSTFELGTWVHVEVRLRAAEDATGALSVDQDGQRVIELTERPTRTGGAIRLALGSFASDLAPLPARLWIDDVSLYNF